MTDDDKTMNLARFGIEVEVFLSSPVGRYVKDMADAQALAAMDKLSDADPHDAEAIRKLQNEIKVARSVMEWLAGAVQRGHNALRTQEAREATD